jgi:ATP-dependent Clp protease ATP-binding subunit ClpA
MSFVSYTIVTNYKHAYTLRWTKIPVSRLTSSERDKLLHLKQALASRVIGQDQAVEAVSDAILRSRAGLSRGEQPTGSFLFLGPTGMLCYI